MAMAKMKLQVLVSGVIASLFYVGCAHAKNADLVGVYNKALVSDPTYKVAEATWLSAKEGTALAMVGTGAAGTGLFPNFAVSGLLTNNYQSSTAIGTNQQSFTNKQYGLTLTQPVFNLSTWSSVREASFGVKSAYANYIAAGQDLINRVAFAYFEVLRANEVVKFITAEKEAVREDLATNLAKYKAGLAAATDMYDSQASYAQIVSEAITDRVTLRNQVENLRAITGRFYTSFKQLPVKLPMISPAPKNMKKWVKIAVKQSYAIQSARMAMLEAKQGVLTNLAEVAPSVNAVGSYDHNNYSQGYSTTNAGNRIRASSGYVGLELDFPLLRGGFTFIANKQDRAAYLKAYDNLALAYATTTNSTRQSYLAITAGIAKTDAAYQAILATEESLKATREAYLVGTRTTVDVLDAIYAVYDAKETWAGARYDYIEAIFQLKYDAGTLSPSDIVRVSSWLKKREKMEYKIPDYRKDPYYDAAHLEKAITFNSAKLALPPVVKISATKLAGRGRGGSRRRGMSHKPKSEPKSESQQKPKQEQQQKTKSTQSRTAKKADSKKPVKEPKSTKLVKKDKSKESEKKPKLAQSTQALPASATPQLLALPLPA
jgi:outer membrane protein